MFAFWIAVGSAVMLLLAYHTYGRWLARRVFQLDDRAVCPSVALNDGHDYVPTRRGIVFGHHFTSIAGTGPIVGPAIAVYWGWLPALLWVLVGSVLIGAVHDLGSLVVSLRSRGQTIGDVAARLISARARLLFLTILFLALAVVIGIFGLVIAKIFTAYPSAVFPIWIQIPIAIAVGLIARRRGGGFAIAALLALLLMYATVWIGAYFWPFDLTHAPLNVPANGAAAVAAGHPAVYNAVVIWTLVLLVYCFAASVLPVWLLLQPRDYINSNQLIVALALVFAGLILAPLNGGLPFVAPAINAAPPADAPPIWPFLFITVACGAISGFHCLVSSGTTSKQLANERDAQFVGYGAMLLEAGLAVVVILACTAGLGRGVYNFDAATGEYVAHVDDAGAPLAGVGAWNKYYGGGQWSRMTLESQLGGFVEGGANLLRAVGLPITLAISLMAVLVACFAATTLDTAARLQRYVITELASAARLPALGSKYVATTIAVVSGGAIALVPGPVGPGSGGLLLWPIFGATNQLLAGLSFLVIAFYLLRHDRPVWFLLPPLVLMVILPTWAMAVQMRGWWSAGNYPPLVLGAVLQGLQIWMLAEAAVLWPRIRGVLPPPLEPLAAPVPVPGTARDSA